MFYLKFYLRFQTFRFHDRKQERIVNMLGCAEITINKIKTNKNCNLDLWVKIINNIITKEKTPSIEERDGIK